MVRSINPATSLVAAFLTSILVVLSVPFAASAGSAARMSQGVAATSAVWSVVARPVGATTTSGALAIDWSVNKGTPFAFVELVNVGTVDLVGQSFTVTTVANTSGSTKLPSLTFEACVNGSWDVATSTCSGTITLMGSASTGTFASPVGLATGRFLGIRIVSSGNPGSNFRSTINASVSSTQIQPTSTINT